MGMRWSFYSVDINRWNQVFGSGKEEFRMLVASAAVGDGYAVDEDESTDIRLPDDDERVQMARKVVDSGISYENLSPKQASVLDGVITSCILTEGPKLVRTALGVSVITSNAVSNKLVQSIRRFAGLGEGKYGRKPNFIARLLGSHESSIPEHIFDLMCVGLEAPGRRLGLNEPVRSNTPYFFLSPQEVQQFAEQCQTILANCSSWPDQEVAKTACSDIRDVLMLSSASRGYLVACYA